MKIQTLGMALFGPHWQTALAEALGVADRTVRRWVVSGEIPEAHQDAVRALIDQRIKLLRSLR